MAKVKAPIMGVAIIMTPSGAPKQQGQRSGHGPAGGVIFLGASSIL